MFEINGNKIILTRGDSFYAVITLKNRATGEDYTPVEGDVIKFGLKHSPFDTECLITKTVPNATQLLYLAPEDTSSLQFGAYVYDIELTYANGDKDTFINNEQFILAVEIV